MPAITPLGSIARAIFSGRATCSTATFMLSSMLSVAASASATVNPPLAASARMSARRRLSSLPFNFSAIRSCLRFGNTRVVAAKTMATGFRDLENRNILEMHVTVCDEPREEGASDNGENVVLRGGRERPDGARNPFHRCVLLCVWRQVQHGAEILEGCRTRNDLSPRSNHVTS